MGGGYIGVSAKGEGGGPLLVVLHIFYDVDVIGTVRVRLGVKNLKAKACAAVVAPYLFA